MKKILISLAFFACIMATINGQNGYWEPQNTPYGGDFFLTKVGEDTLYAVKYDLNWQDFYRSIDKGHSWQKLTFIQSFFPGVPDKSITVGAAGTVFVYVQSQLNYYRTRNDGQTWTPIDNSVQQFLELPSGVMIGVKNSAIVRSVNGGQSWTSVLTLPNGSGTVALKNTQYNGVTAEFISTSSNGTTHILYRTTSDGTNWSEQNLPNNLTNLFVAPSGAILGALDDKIVRSTDGGATFNEIGLQDYFFPTMTALPSGRILIDNNDIEFASDDDGVTWNQLLNRENGAGGQFQAIPALSDGTLFKTKGSALMRSSDSGASWQFSAFGMRSAEVISFKFFSDSSYIAATYSYLLKTTDNGETWSILNENSSHSNYSNTYYLSPPNRIAWLNDGRLKWSENGGNTNTDITPPDTILNNMFFLEPGTDNLFVTTNAGLKRSTDHGQTWQISMPNQQFWFLMGVHPSGRLLYFPAGNPHLFFSDNHGVTWDSLPLPDLIPFTDMKIAPDGDIYLLGITNDNFSHFWKSEDIGQTWVELPAQLDDVLWWKPVFDIAANGHLFVHDLKDVLVSANEGISWQTLPTPLSNYYYDIVTGYISGLNITPNQHLLVGTNYFGVHKTTLPVSLGATIEGFVRADADADCSTDDAQTPIKNRQIKATGADFSYFTNTDPNGRYQFFVDTGSYDVTVRGLNANWWTVCDSVQTVVLPEYNLSDTANFPIVALSECPLMTVNIAESTMRRCFDNTLFVQYCNQGIETADSAWIDVFLDPWLSFVSSNQPHNVLGNNTIRFFVGDLVSGDCGQFQLVFHVDCDSTIIGQTHCISAHAFPDTLCNTVPNWSGATIEASANCDDATLHFTLKNTGNAASQTLDYIIIEDDVVMLQGQGQYAPGQSLDVPIPANGHTYRIESEQEPGHPFSYRAIAFEEGCGGFETLGFINQFSVNGSAPAWHQICRENTGSFDPNDKHGYPLGAGTEHRIRPGQPIEYKIRFQNTGTDTAFTVVVRDTLSGWLDPASVAPGAASHPYTWQLSGEGVISFTFANILLPDSTTNLAGSQGFITFSIAQQPNLPLGTTIRNKAAIFFDFNQPVITNETWHTVALDAMVKTHEPPANGAVNVLNAPNPATEFTIFEAKKGDFKGCLLEIFDGLGKRVVSMETVGNQFVVPRNNLPAGAYGWRITQAGGQLIGNGVVVFR